MSGNRRSSDENVKKRAKTHKSSLKESSDKTVNDANLRACNVAATSASIPKASSVRAAPAMPPVIKAPEMFSLMDMIADPKGEGQISSTGNTLKISKDVSSKDLVDPMKNASSSSANDKAKIQDKTQDKFQDKGLKPSSEAKIQDKDMDSVAAPGCIPLRSMSELRQMAANLGSLSDCSRLQLPSELHIQPRGILSPSAGGELFLYSATQEEFLPFDVTFDSSEVSEGPLLACDEPFVVAANRIRLPQVEDELVLQGRDTLYKSLISLQVKSLAITHASLHQYKELSRTRLDRDKLCESLNVLETKVKEKDKALALSEKRVADLTSEKESLSKSTEDFKIKEASLEKQIDELGSSLAKAREANWDLREKVDVADQEAASA
ncbi:hypothetical protein EJB05_56760, partial [Eragrostis curvula]